MLRCLNAHPKIHVVHQILEPEPSENRSLYRRLKKYKHTTISAASDKIRDAKVSSGATLLLKNATWTHQWSFRGFVLVRNPMSVMNSLKVAYNPALTPTRRSAHISRWATHISPALLEDFVDKSIVEKVAMLYEAKMLSLATCGLPIVRYEEFVCHPEMVLRNLLKALNIPWSDSVLNSHQLYQVGQLGHGKMPLWKPIHSERLNEWKKLPTEVIGSIQKINSKSMKAFGYELKDGDLILQKGILNLVSPYKQ